MSADGPSDETAEAAPVSPSERLPKVNEALAAWAARSASDSDALLDRFERMGYAVRGKSEDAIAEVLSHPPTEPARD